MEAFVEEVVVRHAGYNDLDAVTWMIKALVTEMKKYGGRDVSDVQAQWNAMRSDAAQNLRSDRYCFAIAEDELSNAIGIGIGRLDILDKVYDEMKYLHISGLYVKQGFRNHGVARDLMGFLQDWGEQSGCEEVLLNVLPSNPAVDLYKGLGFSPYEIKMRKILPKRHEGTVDLLSADMTQQNS